MYVSDDGEDFSQGSPKGSGFQVVNSTSEDEKIFGIPNTGLL